MNEKNRKKKNINFLLCFFNAKRNTNCFRLKSIFVLCPNIPTQLILLYKYTSSQPVANESVRREKKMQIKEENQAAPRC